ncbi:hypothetical protein BM524_08205 [Alteromonas mediterranea]|uniref:Uncharacterized protein n=1 Tax=Alteromonas mediterranea TaxID=314275 RepID=A0AAC9J9U9_9ALTE|nr:hypothetical protein [Alteromonas mediterranea]APD89768.1 hypothetical protein BM524_08205 [Alteromonas mediterranea]
MNKLLKLKQYLSIYDSADYLSATLEETVSVADIYELSLEGHLTISIRLTNQAYAKKVVLAPELELTNSEERFGSVQANEVDEKVHIFNGLYDLAMIGEELFELRKLYQREVEGDSPVLSELSGFYVKHEGCIYKLLDSLPVTKSEESQISKEARLESLLKSKGLTSQSQFDDPLTVFDNLSINEIEQVAELISPFNDIENNSSISLDRHSYQLVLKTTELQRFISKINNPSKSDIIVEKPIHPPEKRSFLKFISVLLHRLDISPTQKGITTSLRYSIDETGTPLCDNTVRKILREVDEL